MKRSLPAFSSTLLMAAPSGQQEHLVPLLIVFAVSTFLVVVVAVFTLIRLRKDVNRRLNDLTRRGNRQRGAVRRSAPVDPTQWHPFSMPVLPFWQQLALGTGTLLACAVGVCEMLAGATIPQTLAPVVLPLLLLRPAPKSAVQRSLWAVVVGCFTAAIVLLGVLSLRLVLRQG